MKKIVTTYLMIVFCSLNFNLYSKELEFDDFFSLVMTYLGEDDSYENIDVEELEERLANVYDSPLNWNSVTREQLEQLQFIKEKQIEELLFYADYYGPVHSIAELRLVEDIETPLLLLLPSVLCVEEIKDSVKWNDAFKSVKHNIILRSDFSPEEKKGFINKSYKGYNFRLLTRYRIMAGDNFKAGLTMESDAGEPWGSFGGKGFDLYRAYIEFSNVPHLGKAVMGSYRAGFGKGLLFGIHSYGNRITKVLNGTSYNGLSSYGGTSELPTMSGIALSNRYKNLKFSLFYGYTHLDADTSGGVWHSYNNTGYHRTILELSRSRTLNLHTLGANVEFRKHWWHIGSTIYGGFFSLPCIRGRDSWNVHAFEGKNQWGLSLDYGMHRKFLNFSGETSISQDLGVATTNSLQIYCMSELFFALNYHYFSPRYHSFWSNTSCMHTRVNSEHGVSFACQIPVGRSKTISFLSDVNKHLWPSTYQGPSSIGYELSAEFRGFLRHNVHLYSAILYRTRPVWDRNASHKLLNSNIEQLGSVVLKTMYAYAMLNFTSGLELNVASSSKRDAKLGWLLFQDINCALSAVPLRVKLRLALFDAPTWSNRFYLYESDVPGSGFSPALYGTAFRWYCMADYKFRFGLKLAFRISQVVYADRDIIGSGLDQINSSHKTDMHFYISYQLKSRNKHSAYK